MAQDFLRATPTVFPLRINWTLVQFCTQKKDASVADFRTRFDLLFLRHSGFTETTSSNQFALKYLFMSGLFPDLSQYDRHNRPEWEVMNLMKFVFWLNVLNVF